MLTRRTLLRATLAGAVIARTAPAAAKAQLAEDGLYHHDWFLESFLDIAEDIAGAQEKGKRLAVLWGLRNCPLCRQMHEVHLADPEIEGFIRTHFDVLHLNILGSREVTDLDGTVLAEKSFAETYGIRGTPSIQFFPSTADGLGDRPPREREVLRLEGLPKPAAFLAMFRFVAEGGEGADAFAAWRAKHGV